MILLVKSKTNSVDLINGLLPIITYQIANPLTLFISHGYKYSKL
jgi:hypothetical protein